MSAELQDELADLTADLRGWLGFQRSLQVGEPWAEAPSLPPPPATETADRGSPRPTRGVPSPSRGRASGGRLPRASEMPASSVGSPRGPGAASRLPRASEMPASEAQTSAPSAPPPAANMELQIVRDDLGDCTRCGLHAGRKQLVFGAGNPHADVVFVGEGPGYYEDQQGVPFVGKAGELLDRIITNVLRLDRRDVYICNVLKCRPPNNRDPEPEEIARCSPFLHRQLAAIEPKVVVGLGRFAVNNLLGTTGALGAARGTVHRLRTGVLVATYHPAYLLRNPEDKRKTMADMKLVRAEYERALGQALPPPLKGGGR